MKTKNDIARIIEATPDRSAWSRGVKAYALDMLDGLDDSAPITEQELLNGAESWKAYSYGGCALIYDASIAETLCSPSELRKVRGGERQPNSRETWLDVQARACFQAAILILLAVQRIERAESLTH